MKDEIMVRLPEETKIAPESQKMVDKNGTDFSSHPAEGSNSITRWRVPYLKPLGLWYLTTSTLANEYTFPSHEVDYNSGPYSGAEEVSTETLGQPEAAEHLFSVCWQH